MSALPPDDKEHADSAEAPDVDAVPTVLEFVPFSLADGGEEESAGAARSTRRWWFVAAFVLLAVGLGGAFAWFGGSADDGSREPSVSDAATSTTSTPPPDIAEAEPVLVPAIAPDDPAIAPVPLGPRWAYTAVKTADVLTAPDFYSVEPVGETYAGTLIVDEVCEDGTCAYTSAFDQGRTFLELSEGGQPTAGVWDAEGSVWLVELTAFVEGSGGSGNGLCVLRIQERWKVSLAEVELGEEGWIATSFTGSLVRSIRSEPTLSSASDRVCGEWQILDEWAVTGRTIAGQ